MNFKNQFRTELLEMEHEELAEFVASGRSINDLPTEEATEVFPRWPKRHGGHLLRENGEEMEYGWTAAPRIGGYRGHNAAGDECGHIGRPTNWHNGTARCAICGKRQRWYVPREFFYQ